MSAPGAFSAQLADQEPDDTPDCDLLMHFVEICLAKLSGPERDKFVGALHSLLSSGVDNVLAPPARNNGNGNGNNNGQTNGDRSSRSGNRTRSGDRRPAQDAAIRSHVAAVNQRGFFQRFPEAMKISIQG
jgi:hypothetical protein